MVYVFSFILSVIHLVRKSPVEIRHEKVWPMRDFRPLLCFQGHFPWRNFLSTKDIFSIFFGANYYEVNQLLEVFASAKLELKVKSGHLEERKHVLASSVQNKFTFFRKSRFPFIWNQSSQIWPHTCDSGMNSDLFARMEGGLICFPLSKIKEHLIRGSLIYSKVSWSLSSSPTD